MKAIYAKNQKKNGARLVRLLAFSFFTFFISTTLFAQPPAPPKPKLSETPTEKSIAVDAKVNIRLCVADGDLKINGWERSEIRAFVSGGRGGGAFGFKVLQRANQTGVPVWVAVASAADAAKNKQDECLSGDTIELDVPRGATVSVKSRESETSVDSVARASIENVGGNIYLNRVAQGVEATTYEGDITIENSGGAISLQTTTGNVVAFALAANDIGDAFKAKTNSGAIILRAVRHRQIEATSNSGAIRFAGEFPAGGQYAFSAFNGSINLQIPPNSACKINAAYGFGSFNSDLPLTNVVKSFAASRAQNLSAQIGAPGSEAVLVLTTYSGTIQIKKQ